MFPDLISSVRCSDEVSPNNQQNSSLPCKCVHVVTVVVGAIDCVIAIFDSMLNLIINEQLKILALTCPCLAPSRHSAMSSKMSEFDKAPVVDV